MEFMYTRTCLCIVKLHEGAYNIDEEKEFNLIKNMYLDRRSMKTRHRSDDPCADVCSTLPPSHCTGSLATLQRESLRTRVSDLSPPDPPVSTTARSDECSCLTYSFRRRWD